MANKSNMSGCFNILSRSIMEWYVNQYSIPSSLNPTLPEKDTTIYPFIPGKIGVYTRMFDYCNYRLPLTKCLVRVLMFHEVHLSQMNPFGLAKVCQIELACRGLDSEPDLDNASCYSWITSSLKDWKDHFFWVDDRCVQADMVWRPRRSSLPRPLPEDFNFIKGLYVALIKEAGRIQKFSEHILVMGRISTIWPEPNYFPTIRWNGEVMGLKEALRLKSSDSSELDIRAKKTPNGDPPYLSIVNENLNEIRGPAFVTGQGGSSSAPITQAVNVVPVQAMLAAGGDKGKRTGSSRARGSSSKIVLYGSEHLSVEDEGMDADGDDVGDQPRENLSAHLHGGKTPRDQPFTLPASPISFRGPTTKVIADTEMLDPLAFKKINLSPSGKPTTWVDSNVSRLSPQQVDGGDSASSSPLWYETEAVFICQELKYVPDWSLPNKDRIIDALTAKMSLFHLGTPAEHFYYRRMSGPELGNTLMLNQDQSNSLVVESYKRWVEAESNCRRYEHEVASLKNEENIRSKTKQELSSLRAQVDHLKEQVSKMKESNKATQASATAAYEARDKAIQDLEDLKSKFEVLEKKLSGIEEEHKTEQQKMQSTYDQLLADHLRLVNEKAELERARDRAIESHQTAVADMKDMLNHYDGEMVELYGLSSELLLTKQWFLTEGVAWVVKLGFQATKTLAKTVDEILGYDEGAKDTLDATIKAFDDFHISVLDKVSELVNEPLSVIKERSRLPIVKED
ncbi:hypothetical protein Hanom_Chr12g01150751 [Helianthus anomalus]